MKALFLDRDGTLLWQEPHEYIREVWEAHFITGALEALRRLSRSWKKIIVVTNQHAVGEGRVEPEALERIHRWMIAAVEHYEGGHIDGVYACLHPKSAGCRCRKPGTLMFEEACREHGIEPEGSVMVGDSLSDLQAAVRMGMQPVLVLTGYGPDTMSVLRNYPDRHKRILETGLVADDLYCYAFGIDVKPLAAIIGEKDASPAKAAP